MTPSCCLHPVLFLFKRHDYLGLLGKPHFSKYYKLFLPCTVTSFLLHALFCAHVHHTMYRLHHCMFAHDRNPFFVFSSGELPTACIVQCLAEKTMKTLFQFALDWSLVLPVFVVEGNRRNIKSDEMQLSVISCRGSEKGEGRQTCCNLKTLSQQPSRKAKF